MAVLWEALAWARRGLKCFGLPSGYKVPDSSFPELATTDPKKLTQLWRDPINGSKDLNIGVLCGDGIVIADIDIKNDKKFNRSAVANYEAVGGHFNTLTVKTASGGFQCYFRIPKDKAYANAQNLVPGVDIRCENGYGIAPGSFSLESGGTYELYVDREIAEIPEALLSILKPVRTRKERFNGHADAEKAVPMYVDYLQRVEPAIEGQGGDTHTYNVACMGVRDFGLTTITVSLLMLEHFNPRCQPPWLADELIHKVENADAYAIGEVGTRDPEHVLEKLDYTPPPVQPVVTEPSPYVFVPGQPKELMPECSIPITEWLVYPMVVPRELTIMVGPGGVGKSTFLIALACHAAVGKDFGPYKIKRAIDVLLYNPEDSMSQISGRAAVTCNEHGLDWAEVRQHLHIMDQESEMLTFVEADNGRGMRIPEATEKYFTEYVNARPTIELIIVDPLRKVLSGINENDNAQMSLMMRFLNKFTQRLRTSLLISHHTVKNLMRDKNLDPDSPDLSVGAGSTVSSARIVANILPQTQEDVEKYGRQPNYFSSRISKSNHGPSGISTLQWWERKIVRAGNGGLYPTPVMVDIKTASLRLFNEYVNYIGDDMVELNKNSVGVAEAASIIYKNVGQFQSHKSLTETVRRLFNRGVTQHPFSDIHGNAYIMMLDTDNARRQEVVLVPQTGFPTPPPATMVLPKQGEEPDEDAPAEWLA